MLPLFRVARWGFLAVPSPALACSLLVPEPLFGVADPLDTTAPLAAEVHTVEIRRGQPAPGVGEPRSSCDDLGWVTLLVTQPPGDTHAPEDVGYLLELDQGALPPGVLLPLVPWKGSTLVLPWIDIGPAQSTPVAFHLRLTAVDAAGNRAPSIVVPVTDAATRRGCGHGAPDGIPLLLAWFAVAVRLKRRP